MWVKVYNEILLLKFPDEFIVEYKDGKYELLLRGEGVAIEYPCDDPEGIGGIMADIPKKHPNNQKQMGRYIRFNEIISIRDRYENIIWKLSE